MTLVFPTSPSNGDEYQGYVYDSTDNVWNRLPNNPEFVRFSETAPSNPQEGTLWFNSTIGKMFVYYNDGTSSQWVSAIGGTNGYSYEQTLYYTSSGTFDKADYPWLKAVKVKLVGGGGGGGTTDEVNNVGEAAAGAGGAGAGYAERFISDIQSLSSSENIIVGSGGAGGLPVSPDGAFGQDGSDSSFAAGASYEVIGYGGVGGTRGYEQGSYSWVRDGLAGSGGVGDFVVIGSPGGPGMTNVNSGWPTAVGGNGGSSHLGGGADGEYVQDDAVNDGIDALGYGAGGSGGCASARTVVGGSAIGGAGANGIVILELYS